LTEFCDEEAIIVRALIRSILIAAVLVGIACVPASASEPISGLVTDVASTATPRVPGGDCYPGVADPSACRRVLSMLKAGSWIYVGGIVSDVYDPGTGVTTGGFHNLFRFNAKTHRLDTTWKPQAYRTTTTYRDAGVSGLAVSADGSTLYASGGFTTVASGPGQPGVVRRGVAAFSTATGAVQTGFNARVCAGGGPCVVNDVKNVNGTLWLGGNFTHIAGLAKTALASVAPNTGALTNNISVTFSGVVTTTVGTKVHRIAINPQQTKAAVIGNFSTVNGVTHKEVVLLNVAANGGSSSASSWNAPTYLNASQTDCQARDTWARGVDWDPTGTYFDIAASGGGGFDAFPGLCDAFTRFKGDTNSNATPLIVNYTGFDSLFAVCDTGSYVYTGGHNKSLNHAVYINGSKVKSTQEYHYGLGVIDVNPQDPGYGRAISGWNNTTATGRGAGWSACLSVSGGPSVGGGVYMGGDAATVNGNRNIQRLAYFPG
jgi:hypothetical protein